MSESTLPDATDERVLPSRRAVIGAAVWATPVVMGLTATPAFAASGEFSDYFDWGAPTLVVGFSAIQLNYAPLRYVGSGTATGSIVLTTTPDIPAGWVAEFDQPDGGNFSISSGGIQGVGFRIRTGNHTQIPAGTYTVIATFSFTVTGSTASRVVTYSWTVAK